MLKFGDLLKEHNAGVRRIPVASFRELFPEVSNDEWQYWRERCGVLRRARMMSRFSALKLWILAGSKGRFSGDAAEKLIGQLIKEDRDAGTNRVEEWLYQHEWAVGKANYNSAQAVRFVMDSINNIAPCVDVVHRRRLYEWFRKAGLRFSTKKTYNRQEILRVVTVALRGVGRGRKRSNPSFG